MNSKRSSPYVVPPLRGRAIEFSRRGFRLKAGLHTIIAALLVAVSTFAANWPQFRGPHASGLDDSAAAPTNWDVESGKNIRWKTPIPGLAHSSPIVWNDRVYVITAVRPGKADLKVGLYGDIESAPDQAEHEWRILAIDRATGKVIWNQLGHKSVPRVQRHPKSTHASSTPATDGRKIVAIFGSEGLFCFDTDGRAPWKKDLGPMDSGFYMVPSAQWGFASSPVIHDGKIIVQCDVQTNSFLAAFSLEDGKELWRTPRNDVPSWSTPTIVQNGSQTEIFVNGWNHIGGYDFQTGKEIWKLDGGGDIPVPTPIVANGLAYFTSAHGRFRPMRAIRLDAKGDITPSDIGGTNAAIVWAHARQGDYMQTPIAVGNYIYGCLDNGVVTCFDAKTGEIKYSERLSSGNEGFTASPVSDGKNIFFTSETGKIYIVPAMAEFSVAGIMRMGETCMASPALVNGTLFFRTRENLVAVGR
jgi:outer membrane protein assembly factor BamB